MKGLFVVLAVFAIAALASAQTTGKWARADITAFSLTAEPNLNAINDNHVLFEEVPEGIQITIKISGLTTNPNGEHGIHVHTYGDISSTGAVGSHWDPDVAGHGCDPNIRSAGDLGNWTFTGGELDETRVFSNLFLDGAQSIIGRSIVIHETFDDCISASSAAGRIAAGVIGIRNVTGAGNTNLAQAPSSLGNGPFMAACKLMPTANGTINGVTGFFYWTQDSPSSPTVAAGTINRTAQVGVHVHAWGDLSDRTTALITGGHFAGGNAVHDLPSANTAHHRGDMGNTDPTLLFDNVMWYYGSFDYMSIQNNAQNQSIIGHGFVVHTLKDQGAGSATGNAGGRDAQCVVGITNPASTAIPAIPQVPTAPTQPQAPSGNASTLAFSAILALVAIIAALL